ncbi:leucine-rich repeat-containing protein C10orf11-like [Fopius arisanus]|uniref:Leucine-rich repeat-containing protein C10orf11-like n=1 Tax=Fopius arisanus TaxID=64838 RepID=A0A9R1TE91_9HYME|nr:PREDICTED: leucine-rich repeat-containing protein C10orf11-like [Fopius arisanus]
MALMGIQDFNRSGLTMENKKAWYTGQRASKIPRGLVKVVGEDCLSLDLSYNELTSLSALINYNHLQELILDNNDLHDLKTLPHMPNLHTLSLNNNKIDDIDLAIDRIKECCPSVMYLSLLGNPGYPDQLTDPMDNDEADYNRYRLYVIHILPGSLRFLDSRPVTSIEKRDALTRGKFLRTIKFSTQTTTNTPGDLEFDDLVDLNCSPLPKANRSPLDHKAAFGKCRYRYSGKNSEGNRYIMNNDL